MKPVVLASYQNYQYKFMDFGVYTAREIQNYVFSYVCMD